MAVRDITPAQLLDYVHESPDEITSGQIVQMKAAALAFIRSYTGQDDEYINAHDEFDAVLMALVADLYDTRAYRVDNDKVNPFVQSVLDMHRVNLL